MAAFAFLIAMFPRKLPWAVADQQYLELEQRDNEDVTNTTVKESEEPNELPASISDFVATLKRQFRNKISMSNILAAVFYAFGLSTNYITPKYLEIQYKRSASSAR